MPHPSRPSPSRTGPQGLPALKPALKNQSDPSTQPSFLHLFFRDSLVPDSDCCQSSPFVGFFRFSPLCRHTTSSSLSGNRSLLGKTSQALRDAFSRFLNDPMRSSKHCSAGLLHPATNYGVRQVASSWLGSCAVASSSPTIPITFPSGAGLRPSKFSPH